MATKQILFGAVNASPHATSTQYHHAIYGRQGIGGQTSLVDYNGDLIPTGGTISKWKIKLASAPGEGKSLTFTLMLNGAEQALTITISGSDTTGSDSAHSVALSALDYIHVKCVPSGTPTVSSTSWTFEWVPTTDGEYIYGESTNNVLTGSGTVLGQLLVPFSGTCKKLSMLMQTAPGAGATATLTAKENTVAQSLVVTIADAAETGQDTTHTFTSVAGDYLEFYYESTRTTRLLWAVVFVPDDTSECFEPGATVQALNSTSTNYGAMAGRNTLTTTADAYAMMVPAGVTFTGVQALLTAAPGDGKSRTVTLRKGGDTDVSATISGAATTGSDTGSSAAADYDLFGFASAPSGTPAAASAYYSWIYSTSTAAPPYDDGTPDGGIVFGGEVVEVGTVVYSDGTSSGGIVMGGAVSEDEPDEVHQIDGTASGGIVFGGEVAEQWTAVPNTLVAVKGGTYRISGTIYTLAETLTYTGLGSIAAIVNCGDPPAVAGQYRYDLLSINAAGTITVTAGTASTTPVMPTLPANEVRLDHVLRYYGQVSIIQADIGKIWTAPVLTTLTVTVDDDELAWGETDTDIDIVCRDQYGQLYTGGKVINSSITTGNGTLTPASRSGSASTMTFNYTRDGEVTDVSPVLTFTSSTGPFVTVFVRLLDDSGDLMV